MSAKSLSDLRTAARQLANYETSDFVTDAELTARVNEAVGALYDEILKAKETYFNVPFEFTLTGGIGGNSVALPADFYKARALDRNPGTSSEGTVDALPSYNERHIPQRLCYDIDANGLTVYPAATAGAPYRLWYTPLCPVLADPVAVPISDGDFVDGTSNTWLFSAGSFTADDVGETMTVSGTVDNNGTWPILSVTDATHVVTTGPTVDEGLTGATVTTQAVGTVNVLPTAMNIWALYIELFVAIAILDKAEQDSGPLQARLNQQIARIQALAPSRRAAPLQVPLPAHGGRFRRFWGH